MDQMDAKLNLLPLYMYVWSPGMIRVQFRAFWGEGAVKERTWVFKTHNENRKLHVDRSERACGGDQ